MLACTASLLRGVGPSVKHHARQMHKGYSYSFLSAIRCRYLAGNHASLKTRSATLHSSVQVYDSHSRFDDTAQISENFDAESLSSLTVQNPTCHPIPDTSPPSNNNTALREAALSSQADRSPAHPPRVPGAPDAPLPAASATLAPYVLASPGLRQLVALGVDTSGWDRRPGVSAFVVKLDFERDMRPHVQWLHDAGVPADRLGAFITRNPLIFKERLDDLQVRVNYLEAKRFSRSQIVRIISHNPFWLLFNTRRIDRRLAFFVGHFQLRAAELREVAAKCPALITSNLQHVKDVTFTVKEEFGFSGDEMKQLLLQKPGVWLLSRKALQDRLQFLHNEMGLSHERIAGAPNVLTFRAWRVRQRHLMLNTLGRDQYDCTRPGYVSLDSLVSTTDEQFCRDVARVPVATYNEFLKTL